MFAATPEPPYYAVIFTSRRTDADHAAYEAMAMRMVELAKVQPGFLGIESAREAVGITVSYWRDLESIRAWKQQVDHREAQRLGHTNWYDHFVTRIARVERDYASKDDPRAPEPGPLSGS